MFKTTYYIVGITFLLLTVCCSKSKTSIEPEPTPDPPRISISPTSKTIKPAGETFTVNVTSNRKWSIVHMPAWVTASKSSGEENEKTTLTCHPILTTTSRSDSVVFKTEEATTRLLITQNGLPVTLSLDRESETVPATAGFFELIVTTNDTAWKTSGTPPWITLSPESAKRSETVKVSYSANKIGKERKASINFSAGEASRVLVVTQATADTIISIDKTSENVSATAGNLQLELSITGGISWNTTHIPDWISLSPDHGTGNQSIHLTYQANTTIQERSATITFFSGSKTCTFRVTQEAAATSISIDRPNENISASAGSINIHVTTNGATWSSSGVPEWITLSPAGGTESQSVTLTYKANTTATTRNATITFSAGSENCTLRVTQEAAATTLSIDRSNENVAATAGSMIVNVTTNGATWSTSGVPEWITLTPAGGTGSQSVTLTYKANTTATTRNATITFSAGSENCTLRVTQEAAATTLSIDRSNENVTATAGSMNINVTTNGAAWSTSGVPEWITLTPAGGTGSQSVTLTYKANTTATTRNATITFSAGSENCTLRVTQEAAATTLSIDKSNENVTATGGNMNINVTTNGAAWSTSGVPEWITLTPAGGTGTQSVTLTYKANTTATTRNATITFSAGSENCTLRVTQEAAAAIISIDKSNESVTATGGNMIVNVTTNEATWSTSGVPEWITLSPAGGTGSQSVTLTYKANTITSARSEVITFSAGSENCTLRITQEAAAATISIDRSNENVTATAGSMNINVTTNGAAWSSSGVPEWITLSPAGGAGSQSVTLSHEANTTGDNRSAAITFTSGSNSCTLNIAQAQNDMLEIIKTDYSVKATGGTVEVSLRGNIAYTVSADVDWITEITTRGLSEQTRKFSVKANDSKQKRVGHITFSGSGISRTVTIVQSESGDLSVDIGDWDDDGTNHGGTAE